jgi:DNA invertase Pin-like site-specific DNA recombinase
MSRRAAIYARISEDRKGDELGVRRQVADCRALAASQGYEVVAELVDNDLSASSGRRRPNYEKLLDALQGRTVDAVIAWHPDRLHRRPVELEAFIDAVEGAGASVLTVNAGTMDLATPSGRLVARMLGAAARHEVDLKSDRAKRKHRELAERGLPSGGGTRPFGFADDRITVVPVEADLIREAADHIVRGGSLRSICTDWRGRGIVTTHGIPWHPSGLSRMLRSPRIAGFRSYSPRGVRSHADPSEAELFPAVWEPIITREQHARLVRILTDPSRRSKKVGSARRYLLTGYLRCGRCGAKMVARPRSGGARRYACVEPAGCNRTFHLAESLEAFVAAALLESLEGRDLDRVRRAVAKEDRAAVDAATELASLQGRRDEIAEAFADGGLTLASFQAADRRLEAKAEVLRVKLASLQGDAISLDLPTTSHGLRDSWGNATLDRRRAILSAFVDGVVLHPALKGRNRFDPDRIEICFRR